MTPARATAAFIGLYLLGAVATALAAVAIMNHLDGRLAQWSHFFAGL